MCGALSRQVSLARLAGRQERIREHENIEGGGGGGIGLLLKVEEVPNPVVRSLVLAVVLGSGGGGGAEPSGSLAAVCWGGW